MVIFVIERGRLIYRRVRMARHLSNQVGTQEHKFDLTKGEYVNILAHKKKEPAFRWLDPRTWLYLWYYHYEVQLQWSAHFRLSLIYVDTIARSHDDRNSLAVTLVPTFFRNSSPSVETDELYVESCKTTITIPECDGTQFSLSIKLST